MDDALPPEPTSNPLGNCGSGNCDSASSLQANSLRYTETKMHSINGEGKVRTCFDSTAAACMCLFMIAVVCFAQGEQSKDGRYYEAQARQAYAAKDYALFLQNISKAAELRPNHPRLMYNLAVAFALNGKPGEALACLGRLADMGLVMPAAGDQSLSGLRESARFKQIVASFEKNRANVGEAAEGFIIKEKGLITEGLAYDPQTESYFVSSVHKRKIVRVDKYGKAADFATAEQGLWAAMGMKVDAERRLLWVASAAIPQMVGFKGAENGFSGIFKFDLTTGRLLREYVLENRDAKHVLGDLVLSRNGDVFTTDSLSPAIYAIPHDTDRLQLFLADGRFSSPQGLAFSAGEKWLFMADYGSGLFAIDKETKEVRHVAPGKVTLVGIDGLYFYNGDLIGVQNGVNPQRVVRFHLADDLRTVRDFKILCANNPRFDEPTLGVVFNNHFLFLANSQWGKISDDGKLAPDEQLLDPVILKLKL